MLTKNKNESTMPEQNINLVNNSSPLKPSTDIASLSIENSSAFNSIKEIESFIIQLQEFISQIEEDQNKIKSDWINHTLVLSSSIKQMTILIEKLQMRYTEIIEKQKSKSDTSLLFRIAKLMLKFVKPRIGVLHQYKLSTPIYIPKHYYKKIKLKQNPKIAIVTPSYNQGEYIERTITSVLSQRYSNIEYVIQDGNSNDETRLILEKYSPYLKHWESASDKGQSNAINLGFRHAQGDIMAYLNSDDILLPGALSYVANYFNEHPDVDVVYGHRIIIDEYDHEIGRWILPQHDSDVLTWADYIPQETLFWRRSIWEKSGARIDESFKFAMDWDLLLRFRENEAKFVRLPRFLGGFRVHAHQKTSAEIQQTGFKEMQKLRNRCHGRYVAGTEIKEHIRPYQMKHLLLHHLYSIGLLRY